jgi:hypothetical protein
MSLLPSIDSSPPLTCLHPLHMLDRYIESLSGDPQSTKQTEQQRIDEILRVTDVLYGPCLDGALQVLEQNCTADGRSLNVTRLQSPRRSLFTVKGSSSSSSSSRSATTTADSCYMCILPETNQKTTTDEPRMYYCSCRSFLERSRSCNSICKHLLAIKLMPVLGMTCAIMEVSSEEEFSRAVLRRLPHI